MAGTQLARLRKVAAFASALAALLGLLLRRLWLSAQQRVRVGRIIRLLAPGAPAAPLGLIAPRELWDTLPDWISLSGERGKQQGSLQLGKDPYFRDPGDPQLFPFLPPKTAPAGRGAAVIVPGGNYEFLTPAETEPIARWVAESIGVPAYVLKYRLLPSHAQQARVDDLQAAVRTARERSGGEPVVTFGFSAGAHLVIDSNAVAAEGDSVRSDAQVLAYPSIDPNDWLDEKTAGFFAAKVTSPEVLSLAAGRERLMPGDAFVKPPPTFLVSSELDFVCHPSRHSDVYAYAAHMAGVPVEYMRGPYGPHGFGLHEFWSVKCVEWLRGLGIGRDLGLPVAEVPAATAEVAGQAAAEETLAPVAPEAVSPVEPESAVATEPEPPVQAEPEPAAPTEPEPAVPAEPEPAAPAEPEPAAPAEPGTAAPAEPETAAPAEPESAGPGVHTGAEDSSTAQPEPGADAVPSEPGKAPTKAEEAAAGPERDDGSVQAAGSSNAVVTTDAQEPAPHPTVVENGPTGSAELAAPPSKWTSSIGILIFLMLTALLVSIGSLLILEQ